VLEAEVYWVILRQARKRWLSINFSFQDIDIIVTNSLAG
jgi:hypothetical protein